MSTTEPRPTPDSLDTPVDIDTGRLDHASRRRVFAVLAIIILYTETVPLQYAMVAPALQKISGTFPTVGANISWSMIILGLVGAAATPLLGKASDIWGKRRLFLICGVLFLAGCVIDALTSNWTLFLIGRGLSAFSVATQAIAYGLIRDLIPRRYIPVGIAMVGAGFGFSGGIAPLLSGVLVDHFGWRSMFWFLAIFTLVLTPLVLAVVPETKIRVRERIDPLGAVLLSAGALFTLLYLDNGGHWGWTRPATLAWLIVGLLLLALFFVVELRVSTPIMDMRLLLNPKVSLVLLMTLFGCGFTGVQPVVVGYMTQTPDADSLRQNIVASTVAHTQQASGTVLPPHLVHVSFDPGYTYGNGFTLLQFGLHIGIWVGVIGAITGLLGGALARRIGARIPAIIAFALLVLSAIGYIAAEYSWSTYLVLALIGSAGFGFFYAAVPNLIVEAVPPQQQGVSAGMLGVTMSLGTASAIAITSAMLNSPVVAHIEVAGHTTAQALPQVFTDSGYTHGFIYLLVTVAIALTIAILMRHGRTPTTGGSTTGSP
ncbi:MFS transporter [Nocardia sp. CA2R105]|uniref:MFS transporter n=1 Tax=Nocardia coffeae TaxID=2873381 RepID=UPI001CA75A03|nr:MFS transporter [Nocardia coffeae]MBY8862332.1 MFS transporter [Nocardia coffeae]